MPFKSPKPCATLAMALCLVVPAITRAQDRAPALEPEYETVTFPSADREKTALRALLLHPTGQTQKRATVLMFHGCGGMFTPSGRVLRRDVDWSARFRDAGYSVLLVDSFGSRGLGSQCTVSDRVIRPIQRARDAEGAIAWLSTQPWADPSRMALIGWSNGGSTMLHYVRQEFAPKNSAARVRAVIAVYPGCRALLEREGPRTGLPLEIHIGAADDWTPPEPCVELSKAWNVPLTLYPGAYHGFDSPDAPVRVRTGLATSKNEGGRAHVGTNPEGRERLIGAVMTRLKAVLQ